MFAALNSFQVGGKPTFVSDVFSTSLYTGNGSTQTITNGIDLSTKGGLVWTKTRTANFGHYWIDTVRGVNQRIQSETTGAQAFTADGLNTFNSNGYSLGINAAYNFSGDPFVSWTFREQRNFFDIVTYTGNGVANRQIAHSLGSTPGCIIVKSSSIASNWQVWQRAANVGSGDGNAYGTLNATSAFSLDDGVIWGDDATVGHVEPTSTNFTVSANSSVNSSGNTYVAYIYAHDAGGFGFSGNDNVISCGSYTGNGSATGPIVTLGYQPQWLLIKRTTGTANGNWLILDVMRGFGTSTDNDLYANLSNAEGTGLDLAEPQSTGFQIKSSTSGVNASGDTYIYIAIKAS
jgi:hypothetical protein